MESKSQLIAGIRREMAEKRKQIDSIKDLEERAKKVRDYRSLACLLLDDLEAS